MHGGFARCNVSRYSVKFLVLPISVRICSSDTIVFWLTWDQVLPSLWMGAVPSAEMMDVSVEKLLSPRHF